MGQGITVAGVDAFPAAAKRRGDWKASKLGGAMRMKRFPGLLLAGVLAAAVGGVPSVAQAAQSSPAPCSVIPDPDPCGTKPATGDKKPSLERFPFPGQTSPAPGKSSPSLTGVAPASTAPPAPAAPAASPSASPDKKFPFPGESSPKQPVLPSAGTSSSSSSSSANGEPNPADAADSAPELKDEGSEGQRTAQPGRHILHRVNPPGTKLQSSEERAAEDVDIAHFYMDRGDFHAAYLRGQDAVKLQPDDPAAHCTLAEAALKLNKADEAIAEYQSCLKLDPTDKQAKAAQKALSRLQAQR